MKNVICLILICSIVSFFLPCDLTANADELTRKTQIIRINGKAEVRLKGSRTWERARVDMILGEGDEVRTKDRTSFVDFTYYARDGSDRMAIFRIGNYLHSATAVKIDASSPGKTPSDAKFILYLAMGRVFSSVAKLKKDSEYMIRTPNCIIGVRGTTFLVSYNKKKGKTLTCVIDEAEIAAEKLAFSTR